MELYSKAFEALNTNKETTMMDYWKSVSICNVIMLAQPGTISSSLSVTWKNIWPDCMKNFQGSERFAEKYKECQKHNPNHMTNKWRRLWWHEVRRGENFGTESNRTHQQRLAKMAKQGDDDSDDSLRVSKLYLLQQAKNSALKKNYQWHGRLWANTWSKPQI